MTNEKDHRLDALYHLGATTIYASKTDPRFSYTLYVPPGIGAADPDPIRILVSMHGTGRMQSLYRDMFSAFAEKNNCIVLAPLFPASVLGDGNMSGYKYIKEQDIRYDLVLLAMLEEVRNRYAVAPGKILLFGFSGGAHFAHRFTILHPAMVHAVSIGAAGAVTLLDPSKPWWAGVKGTDELFGIEVDFKAFKGMPIHLVVGEADDETWEISFSPGDRYYVEGANDAGATRGERAAALAKSFSSHGAVVRLDVVPGAAHDVTSIIHKATQFFGDTLQGRYTN